MSSDASTAFHFNAGNGSAARFKASDNAKIVAGAGEDLQIFHTGSFSKIQNNTGDLNLYADTNVGIYNAAGTETKALFATNGAVELYHDNSKRFETSSSGITVNGAALVGGNIEINQDAYLKIGASNDLQIYHDGSDSYIEDTGTGSLILKAAPSLSLRCDTVNINNNANSENMARFFADGAVELYYDNSKKFETYQYGIRTTQNIDIGTHAYLGDNGEVNLGDNQDFKMYHDGNDTFLLNQLNKTGSLYLRNRVLNEHTYVMAGAGGNVYLRVNDGENGVVVTHNGAVELYHDNSKKLETFADGIKVVDDGSVVEIELITNSSAVRGKVTADSGNQVILATATDENMLIAKADGAVELYYDNSKKFETDSIGVKLEDNNHVSFGTGSDFKIHFDGYEAYLDANAGNVFFRGNSNEAMLQLYQNGGVHLYYDHSKKLETQTQGVYVAGSLGVSRSGTPRAFNHSSSGVTATQFEVDAGDASASTFETACFRGGNDANGAAARVRICHSNDRGLVIDGGRDGNAAFGKISLTDQNGGITQSVHINNSGTWYWGKTGQDSGTNGIELGIDYPNFMTRGADGGTVLGLNDSTGTSGTIMRFYYQDSLKGSLNFNGSTFSTQTHSDYRLKENDTPISDGIARVKQLRPIKFNWKNDSSTIYDGFFAHEVQAVVPAAVTGEKDAEVNAKGEGYQAISQEGLIPVLTAGLKDAIAKIEVLETKVAALEAA
jgi:hypothetical protein